MAQLKVLLKIIFLVGCISGMLYQTTTFLKIYLKFESVVNVEVENSGKLPFPAVTVCNRNRVKQSLWCGRDSSVCSCFSNEKKKKCRERLKAKLNTLTRAERQVLGVKKEDFILECNYDRKRCPDRSISRFFNFYYGNCYTFNAQWGGNTFELSPAVYWSLDNFNTELRLMLHFDSREYSAIEKSVRGRLMVHAADTLPNPELHSVTIEPGRAYRFRVEKRTTKLLPSPYQTNCLDYTTLNREKRTNATVTQENCIDECYIQTTIDTCGCTKTRLAVTYGLNVTICCRNKSLSSCLITNQKRLEDICRARCRVPCKKELFIVDNGDSYIWPQVQEDMDDELNYTTLDDARKNIAWVRVFYRTTEQKVYVHKPRLEAIEIFSLIGGYLGLWLGISLYDLPRIGKDLVKKYSKEK